MRNPFLPEVERGRIRTGNMASESGDGAFKVSILNGESFFVIASTGMGWEHVSVSLERVHRLKRCPTWEEMVFVKNLFFQPEEAVVQIHPPESQYVNCHEYVLHLWRPTNQTLPLPFPEMVGPRPKKRH